MRDGGGGVGGEWFRDCVTKVVGDGRNTYFWTDPWLDGIALSVWFRRLYGLSVNKHRTVEDMYVLGWEEGGEVWQWRRRLWDWEKGLVGECQAMLANVTLHVTESDEWRWRLDNSGKYYVCSIYDLLTSGGNYIVDEASTLVWHIHVPLKVFILAWRLLCNRLPKKTNLAARGIFAQDAHLCVSGCG